METFTLLVSIWMMGPAGGWHEIKRPGYSEVECNRLATKVHYPTYATCLPEGRKVYRDLVDPVFTDLERPKRPRSMVICPTWPPCWQDGEPIVGALGRP
jgi:hypothetical protein